MSETQTTAEETYTRAEVKAGGNGIHARTRCVALTYGDDRHANARRIAALWNEAERMGLSTEEIETGVLSDLRDALKDLVQADTDQADPGLQYLALEKARTVLSRIEGAPSRAR